MSETLLTEGPMPLSSVQPYLPAATRQASENGTPLVLHAGNWKTISEPNSKTKLTRKLDKYLEYVAGRSRFPGDVIEVKENLEYPLFDTQNAQEALYLREFLIEAGLLRSVERKGVKLTVKGWERIESPTSSRVVPGTCFVAMSFHQSLLSAYDDGIQPAIEDDCGLKAIRMDSVEHNERIGDRMIAEIRRCEFMVADFTGNDETSTTRRVTRQR